MTLAVATLLVICVTKALITTNMAVVSSGFNDILVNKSANNFANPDF